MKSIGGFFEKFNNKIAKEVRNLVFIVETIKKHTGIEIDMKDLKVSSGILRIKAPAAAKNEIYMKKLKILKDLESLQSIRISDIQ